MHVYKQPAKLCGPYAFLSAMQKLGVNVDESWALSFKKAFASTDFGIQKCISYGLIKGGVSILTTTNVDRWLKKGHYIVVATNKLSFDSVRNQPYIQSFLGDSKHFFCIVEDLGDKWRILDSQGEGFADHGTWYMKKTDFKKLMYPRRLIK